MANFIKNSFSTPNMFLDNYYHLMSSDETKVLIYAVRRILGFQKCDDCISLSQFAKGKFSKEGKQLDHGTNLSVPTIEKCIEALVELRFLIVVAENNPRLNHGTRYAIQLDEAKINHEALARREAAIAARGEKNASRMQKVRDKKNNNPLNAIIGVEHHPLKCDLTPPLNAINTPPIMVFTHNIQGKKEENQIVCVAENPQAPVDNFLPEKPGEQEQEISKPTNKSRAEASSEHLAYLERKKSIEQTYIELLGYKPMNLGEMVSASKQLAERNYDASHVRGYWKHMLNDPFWANLRDQGKHIKLTSIANEIPAWWSIEQAKITKRKAYEEQLARECEERRNRRENALPPHELSKLVKQLRAEQRQPIAQEESQILSGKDRAALARKLHQQMQQSVVETSPEAPQ